MKYKLDTTLTARQRQVYGKRLLKVAELLRSIANKQYDHGSFIESLPTKDCGTVACALGHVVVSRKFRRLPLGIIQKNDGYDLAPTGLHLSLEDAADSYFGPGVYTQVFGLFAYQNLSYLTVPKHQVITRVLKVARERFGVTA